MTTVFLIIGIAFPVLVLLILFVFVRIVAGTDVHDDVGTSRGAPRARTLVGRFRAWLTSTPRRLDYRRDKRGRFRRVRRG